MLRKKVRTISSLECVKQLTYAYDRWSRGSHYYILARWISDWRWWPYALWWSWRCQDIVGTDGWVRSKTCLSNLCHNGKFSTAPISLLNVRQGQPVELRMIPRQGEMYTPPAGVRAFRGAGQRLGAPVPQIASGSSGQGAPSGSNSMPGTFPGVTAPAAAASSSASTTERESLTTRFEVDQSRPTTSIQLRLADGTRYALSYYLVFWCSMLILLKTGWSVEWIWRIRSAILGILSMRKLSGPSLDRKLCSSPTIKGSSGKCDQALYYRNHVPKSNVGRQLSDHRKCRPRQQCRSPKMDVK